MTSPMNEGRQILPVPSGFPWRYIHSLECLSHSYTVNPLYNDIRYNSEIRYSVNLVCTKISGSCIFSLLFPCYSSGKHTFCVFVRIAS